MSQIKCPCCEGKGLIDNPREALIAKLLTVCKGLSDADMNEVILYAEYLKNMASKAV